MASDTRVKSEYLQKDEGKNMKENVLLLHTKKWQLANLEL